MVELALLISKLSLSILVEYIDIYLWWFNLNCSNSSLTKHITVYFFYIKHFADYNYYDSNFSLSVIPFISL